MNKSCLAVLTFACMTTACTDASHNQQSEAEVKRPNIVFILADDLGYSDIGAFGSEIKTPNLDALAAAGMTMTNFHVHTTCSPSRAMLLSGADSHRIGYGTMATLETPEQLGQPGYETYLNDLAVTFPTLLRDAGYHTYISGKWDQGGGARGRGPEERGFEKSYVLVQGMADHFRPLGSFQYWEDADYLENGAPVELPETFYSSETYTSKLIEYIDGGLSDDKPFFAYLALTAPHYPLQARAEDLKAYEGVYRAGYGDIRKARVEKMRALGLLPEDQPVAPAHPFWPEWDSLSDEQKGWEAKRMQTYAAMVTALDRNIGRLVDYLEAKNLLENTLIVFLSDNGPEAANPFDLVSEEWAQQHFDLTETGMGSEQSYTWVGPGWAMVSATPHRLHKHFMTKGGIVSPTIISYPGRVPAGSRSEALATMMDFAPTFLEMAGIEHPGTEYQGRQIVPMAGQSMLSHLQLQTDRVHGDDYVFAMELFDRRMLIKGKWKIIWSVAPWGKGVGEWALYDLESDPTELTDLAEKQPEILQDLLQEWDRYVADNNIILNPGMSLPHADKTTHYTWRPIDTRSSDASSPNNE